MKTIITLLISIAVLSSFTGCGNSSSSLSDMEDETNVSEFVDTAAMTTITINDIEPITEPEEAGLSFSDQILGKWKEYKYENTERISSDYNGYIYEFKADGTVDVLARKTYTGSSWYILGNEGILNDHVIRGIDFKISLMNGEMILYNEEHDLKFYCTKV